jgi:hypothetical protein
MAIISNLVEVVHILKMVVKYSVDNKSRRFGESIIDGVEYNISDDKEYADFSNGNKSA